MVESRLEAVVTRLEALAATLTNGDAAPAQSVKQPAAATAAAAAPTGSDLSGEFSAKLLPALEALEKATEALGVDLLKNMVAMFVAAAKQ